MKPQTFHAVRDDDPVEADFADYYMAQERKHLEMVSCWWFCVKLLVIAICLRSIWLNLSQLWHAFQ